MTAPQKIQVLLPALEAAAERFNELLAGIDIVATPGVAGLAQQLYEASGRCLDEMYRTSERCLEKVGGNPSQEDVIRCLERPPRWFSASMKRKESTPCTRNCGIRYVRSWDS
jgi:hypothetical protein